MKERRTMSDKSHQYQVGDIVTWTGFTYRIEYLERDIKGKPYYKARSLKTQTLVDVYPKDIIATPSSCEGGDQEGAQDDG